MRVGIYNEPSGTALGGAEQSVAVLAQALAGRHTVDIVHHHGWLTSDAFERFSGTDLRNVRLRLVPVDSHRFGDSWIPWRRYHEARTWHADLSTQYDLFINFTH